MNERFLKQLDFIREVDKMKGIVRQAYLMDGSRRENDAEHTWHITLMASVIAEHVPGAQPDLLHVLKMLIIHDLVEIDAGDTFAYDVKGYVGKFDREKAAAERIFGILPEDQGREMLNLWLEFEERATVEAKFANAIDRLHPMLHNFATEGKSWREHGVTSRQVLSRAESITDSIPALGEWTKELIAEAVERGYLLP
ncbi:HD domain-containing protein [Paenibacillus sp. DMB20]|uniref:HD domain-containing protein n=1 Tax=Paenibacillus sp. DMB20 TaxID=1642570 RepID=UPI000627B5CD|nr:HD domain-containing protein [Paenibacillus sp. DMB20]KKO54461.1 phosphohydrolase [Paenibacillus sp. DMB20]